MTNALGRLRDLGGAVASTIEGRDGPRLAWTLRSYRPENLQGDVVAGLTVAALIVPLSIGYAGVAGLPPEVGLYASLAPLVMYAVFGSSRTLVVGPDASTAALIAATIAPLAAVSDERVRLATVLALLVAAVFAGARLMRLGFLADFLSRPILVGYMTGVGITVALGQVEKVLGGPAVVDGLAVLGRIDWSSANPAAVVEAVAIAVRASGANLWSLAVGGSVVALILLGRRFVPRVPMVLVAILAALAASALLDLSSRGVEVLGPVPGGLPPVGVPTVSLAELVGLLPGALGLAMLSFADATVNGRIFSARHGERTDANRELLALAATDAAAGLTGGYPVSSSASRTAAAEAAGSHTQLTGLVAAITLGVVLLLLTGPLSYLPTPALGAVILVASFGLIDVRGIGRIWSLQRSEGAIAILAMTGVILYGTLVGVGVAVLLAALNIVRRAAWPQIAELGRMPDGSWHDLDRDRDARRVADAVVLRFAGPMFFANATALGTRVRESVASRPDARAVVLDLGATADIDLTASGALKDLDGELRLGGRRLAVADPLGRVRDEIRAYGLAALLDATDGRRGAVDEVLRGLDLDPEIPALPPAETPGAKAAIVPLAAQLGVADLRESPVARVLVVGAAIMVGAGLVGVLLANLALGPGEGPRQVPNLVGLPLDRATISARDAGFQLADPVYVARNDRLEGTVVDQDPPAGSFADPGTEIRPLVSTGRQLVRVPDVIGLPEADAIAVLTGGGLTVRRGPPAYDVELAAGSVVATDPEIGTEVATGTSITYIVSLGPEPTPTTRPTAAPTAAPSPPTAAPSPPATASPGPTPTQTPTSPGSPSAEPVPTPSVPASS